MLNVFDIKLARDLGWQEPTNGKLLQAAEDSGFNVLLTGDKNLPEQQNIIGRRISVVALSASNWNITRDYVPVISKAIYKIRAGQILPVFCGRFVPIKFRRAAEPEYARARSIYGCLIRPGGMLKDVRYATRMLRKDAAFTAVAVCSRAIGMGAT